MQRLLFSQLSREFVLMFLLDVICSALIQGHFMNTQGFNPSTQNPD